LILSLDDFINYFVFDLLRKTEEEKKINQTKSFKKKKKLKKITFCIALKSSKTVKALNYKT
jgi:hypothetical protein